MAGAYFLSNSLAQPTENTYHSGLFKDLCIGWPGSVHDVYVFSNSMLYNEVSNGELLQAEELRVTGGTIPVFLIGDLAYPLLSCNWLLKPFSHSSSLSHHYKNYNYRISRGRVVVEMAFGRLKARWRRLNKKIDMYVENVPNIILSCCISYCISYCSI